MREAVDGISFGIVVGAITEILPPIAAGLSIVWLLIRIWESPTIMKLTGRWKNGPDSNSPE